MRKFTVSLVLIAAYLFLARAGGVSGWEAADPSTVAVSSEKCGDVDGDGAVDIDDVKCLIIYVYLGGPAPEPFEMGDVNCDRRVNSLDISYLLAYIFRGGSHPCADCL